MCVCVQESVFSAHVCVLFLRRGERLAQCLKSNRASCDGHRERIAQIESSGHRLPSVDPFGGELLGRGQVVAREVDFYPQLGHSGVARQGRTQL